MTTADALAALAGRCEAATGADRELDCSIAWAVGEFDRYQLGPDTTVSFHRVDDFGRAEIHVIGPKGGRVVYTHDPLHYSASLDAAMSLIDNFGVLMHLSDIGADGLPLARVGCPGLDGVPIFVGIASCIMTDTAPCAGLALALCAAAIRARATTGATDHVE